MREFKFRAWDGEQMLTMPMEGNFSLHRFFGFLDEINIRDLMQYTGLKDKNGKEIYEGDILDIKHTIHRFYTEVVFEDGCFYAPMDKSRYRLGGWESQFVEIIGNIHENPKLLE